MAIDLLGDVHVEVDVHPPGTLSAAALLDGVAHVEVDVHPGGHLTTGRSQFRRGSQSTGVFIRQPWHPRQRIAEITTANIEGISNERMGLGEAVVSLNRNDRNAEYVVEGYLLEIQEPEQPMWIGIIQKPKRTLRETFEIHALGYAAMLDLRPGPLDEFYEKPVGSGQIVRSLLTSLNSRGNTGILPGLIDAGPSLFNYEVGGQQVFEALEEIASRCAGWEWRIRYEGGPGGFEAYLDWQFHPGEDLSTKVHLWSDIHFADLDHESNLSQALQAVTAVGAFGQRLRDRPSITRSAGYAPARRDMAASEVQLSSEAAFLRVSDLPPGIRVEKVRLVSMTEDPGELEREAQEALEAPQDAIETYVGLVNTTISWEPLVVGNYVTVHADFGQGFTAQRCRVVGTNPSRATGVCETYFEVPLR